MTKSKPIRAVLRVIAAIVTILVTVALVRAILRDGPAALDAWHSADVQWTWVAVSTACALGGHAALVFGWRRLLVDSEITISIRQTARLLLVSNLGRYLPAAKAWQMGIVGIIAAEDNLPAARVAASSLFYGLIGVGVGVFLLFATGGATLGVHPGWLAIPVAGLAALLVAPVVLHRLPRIRNIVVQRLPGSGSVTTGTMWALVWTCGASWVAWGIGLYALALALVPQGGASVTAHIAAWIGPLLAGVASIFAPAGLGVRDEVMRTMLVASGTSASGAIVVVVVARAWATALEVVPALVFLALSQRRRNRASGASKP